MKVFISSTYSDLVDIRKKAIEYFSKFAFSIDGMEIWGSSDLDPISKCIKNVSESDLFIGIYGQRYGSIDPPSGKSITELEYIEASKRGIRTLVFIMSEDYPVASKYVDKGKNAEQLDDIKNRIKSEHVVSIFNDIDEFLIKLNASFQEYILSNEMNSEILNLNSIWSEIDAALKENIFPTELVLDISSIKDALIMISELEEQISGLTDFHDLISAEYSKIAEDYFESTEIIDVIKDESNDYSKYSNIKKCGNI